MQEPTTPHSLLKNLFSPAEETDPHFDTELRDDVRSECEGKYGKVLDIYVDKESATVRLFRSTSADPTLTPGVQGEVYIKFADMNAATMALTGLNGRFLCVLLARALMIV